MSKTTSPTMNHRKATWDKRQIKDFVKDVRAHVGAGWAYLVPELRVDVIRSKALGIVQAQARDSIAIESG